MPLFAERRLCKVEKQSCSDLDAVKGCLEEVDDHRLWTQEELEGSLWYLRFLGRGMVNSKQGLTGFSLSQRDGGWLLVSRREEDGIQQVAFTNGRTPMDCMRLFLYGFGNDAISWYKDKYR
jgi:hypothetical protein